jgi:tetratricopeptide (TPR) repeat protein
VRRPSLPPPSALLALLPLALATLAFAGDTIVLTNGRVIQADRAWFEGAQLYYEKGGGVFGLPRSLVKTVEPQASASPRAAPDPDVARAQELARAGQDAEAIRVLVASLQREPRNAPALLLLAQARQRRGDFRGAADAAAQALRLDERDPRGHALLGDAQLALGDARAAASSYRAGLRLRPDAALQKKLDELQPAPRAAGGAQFRLRYDGAVNEPLGVSVLQLLGDAFAEFGRRLSFTPEEPVTVILETEADFKVPGSPAWAEGLYDGAVRIPVKGVEKATPHLRSLLRHELAHSFVTSRTGGNCPTWVQEGVAQWLDGSDYARADQTLAQRARAGTLPALLTLEAPFQNLPPAEVPVAYAASLSGIAHVLRLRREEGLSRLLAALGDGLPSEEALPVSIGLSYGEFQKSWEQQLLR